MGTLSRIHKLTPLDNALTSAFTPTMSTTVDDPNVTLFDGSDWRTYTNAQGGWHGGTYHET